MSTLPLFPSTPVAGRPQLARTITVHGTPAPQGSKKGFFNKHTGRVQMVESSAKVKPWREAVRSTAETFGKPLDEPLFVEMVFTMPKPLSAPKRRRTWPDRTPDLSKLVRSTEDALTDAGVWRDDARVVEYGRLAKVYPGEDPDALDSPGAVIRIYTLGAQA